MCTTADVSSWSAVVSENLVYITPAGACLVDSPYLSQLNLVREARSKPIEIPFS